MRLFLTSDSFRNLNTETKNKFWKLVNKKPKETRVAFIPTASFFKQNKSYVEQDHQLLCDLGISIQNIIDIELDNHITYNTLKLFDVVFVEGGNTFYLLQKTRESGFDKAIAKYLQKDLGVYVGVSAGTIIAGPDIVIAKPYDDESKAKIKNTKGLELTPSIFLPHFQKRDKNIIEKYQTKTTCQIKPLRDGEAVISDGTHEKLIS